MTSPSTALVRPREGAMLAGVCAGLARWIGWDVTLVRLLYILVSVVSAAVPGVLIYVILWVVMPRE